MIKWFVELPHALQALVGGLFTWSVTALGAALVFFFKEINKKVLDAILGFAAGVMLAASYWSLLSPAVAMAKESLPSAPWIPAAVGFLLGGLFLRLTDRVLPHLHPGFPVSQAEGVKTQWERSVLLVFAITLHNIPEGLAIGVAFGALAHGLPSATLAGAMALTIGIGIQNFPEGIAVSVPLRREGLSLKKCFMYGQLSAIVEPFAALIGALLVISVRPLLPYALAFAAGAMIFVVVEELIPESQSNRNVDLATSGLLVGFATMMILDVALG